MKLTPTQLNVLKEMAQGAEMNYAFAFCKQPPKSYLSYPDKRPEKSVRMDTFHAMRDAGHLVEATEYRWGVTYTLTPAGREAAKGGK